MLSLLTWKWVFGVLVSTVDLWTEALHVLFQLWSLSSIAVFFFDFVYLNSWCRPSTSSLWSKGLKEAGLELILLLFELLPLFGQVFSLPGYQCAQLIAQFVVVVYEASINSVFLSWTQREVRSLRDQHSRVVVSGLRTWINEWNRGLLLLVDLKGLVVEV